MKRYFFAIAFLLHIASLTGCSKVKYHVEEYERVGCCETMHPGKACVLHTKTETEAFSADNNMADVSEDLFQKLPSYDDDNFKDNMLIVIYHEEPTSSSKLSVKSVKFETDTANVTIRSKSPYIIDWSMKFYVFLFEVPSDNNIVNATYEIKRQ